MHQQSKIRENHHIMDNNELFGAGNADTESIVPICISSANVLICIEMKTNY